MSLRRRLLRWLAGRGGTSPGEDARWVVVDTETTGLDPHRDSLLAIGAVAIDANGIRLSDSFETTIRNTAGATKENIVVHGIGRATQAAAVPAGEALAAFAQFVGGAPCVGFHSDFDRVVLTRAMAAAQSGPPPARWLDLEPLASVLHPDAPRSHPRGLDDWLGDLAIPIAQRHNAAADALGTAELLLYLRAVAAGQGANGFDALVRLAAQRRWLASGH